MQTYLVKIEIPDPLFQELMAVCSITDETVPNCVLRVLDRAVRKSRCDFDGFASGQVRLERTDIMWLPRGRGKAWIHNAVERGWHRKAE